MNSAYSFRPVAAQPDAAAQRNTLVTGREWGFVAVLLVVVLGLTAIPYWYAQASTPADKMFMGMMLDVPDHLQYFSWMRELTHAHLSANKLTPEPNAPVFFNLLWWGLGRSGAVLNWDYAQMFQLLRIGATTLFLFLVYRMSAWFLPTVGMRRLALLVVTFTSGFGWVLVALKYTLADGTLHWPLTVYVAEGNTFLSVLGYPHFIAAALYIFVFDLLLRGQAKGDLRYAWAAGLVALFFGWQHAYDLVIVYAVLFTYALLSLLRDQRLPRYLIWSGLIVGVVSWWPALYSVLLTSLDPLWKEVLAQFANAGVYTPNLLQLPILLGPAFLLALYTAVRSNPFRLQGVDDRTLFLWAWFWISFVLIYLPVDYQIHMLNGWQVPIAILAVQGLYRYGVPWFQRISGRPREQVQRWLAVALVLVILPTNVYLWAWRFIDLGRHDYPYYLHQDEVAALDWLEATVEPDDVVLSSLTFGQYVPAMTGAHAYIAHWAQTVDFFGKQASVEAFYGNDADAGAQEALMAEFSVDYVVCGPAERAMGVCETQLAYLGPPVYTSDQIDVYRVQGGGHD